MSEELTAKLKQGNLKDGYYYAKMPTGCVDVVSLYNLRQLRLAKDGDKIEVLDIVPDYYQFQNICNSLSEEHRGNYNLIKENKELKAKVHILNMANQNLENNCFKALEYYNKVNINCNYPNKVSQLKSYIKRLIEEREELKELLLKAKEEIQNDMDYTEFNEVGKLKLVKQIEQALGVR